MNLFVKLAVGVLPVLGGVPYAAAIGNAEIQFDIRVNKPGTDIAPTMYGLFF